MNSIMATFILVVMLWTDSLKLETLLPTYHLYLCDNAHNVIKHSHFCHPVLGQDGNIENTKVAEDKRAFKGLSKLMQYSLVGVINLLNVGE